MRPGHGGTARFAENEPSRTGKARQNTTRRDERSPNPAALPQTVVCDMSGPLNRSALARVLRAAFKRRAPRENKANRRLRYISRCPGTPCGRSKQDLAFIPGGNLGTAFRLPANRSAHLPFNTDSRCVMLVRSAMTDQARTPQGFNKYINFWRNPPYFPIAGAIAPCVRSWYPFLYGSAKDRRPDSHNGISFLIQSRAPHCN